MKYKSGYPTTCEYLGQVRDADRRVEQLRERVMNLRMLTTDISVHYTDMPHSDSPDQQKILTILAQIDEMEREIAEAEASAKATRLDVGMTVCRLKDPSAQKVLLLHYLEGKKWKEVAEEIRYSVPRVYQFRDAGIQELDQILATERD